MKAIDAIVKKIEKEHPGLTVDIEAEHDEDGRKVYSAYIMDDPRFVFSASECYSICALPVAQLVAELREGVERLNPYAYDAQGRSNGDKCRALDLADSRANGFDGSEKNGRE